MIISAMKWEIYVNKVNIRFMTFAFYTAESKVSGSTLETRCRDAVVSSRKSITL